MVSALTGIEFRVRDLATCEQVRSSLVNVRNASFLEGPYKWYYPSSTKASKSYCGLQMQDVGHDEQVFQRAG